VDLRGTSFPERSVKLAPWEGGWEAVFLTSGEDVAIGPTEALAVA
jgi:hypothetical protein